MAHTHTKRRQKQKQDIGIQYVIRKTLVGSLIGTVLFFTLLCLAAAVILKKPIETKLFPIISLFISALSAFISGFVAVRPIRKNGILMGLCSCAPLVIIAGATVLFETGGNIGIMTAVMAGIMILCAALGGIAAVNIRQKN